MLRIRVGASGAGADDVVFDHRVGVEQIRTSCCASTNSLPVSCPSRAAVGHFDFAPWPMHVEDNEQIGGVVALTLAIQTLPLPRPTGLFGKAFLH